MSLFSLFFLIFETFCRNRKTDNIYVDVFFTFIYNFIHIVHYFSKGENALYNLLEALKQFVHMRRGRLSKEI